MKAWAGTWFNFILCVISGIFVACANQPDMKRIPYNETLKTLTFETLPFGEIALNAISEPYYEDFSHHESAMARAYKSYDTMGFRDELLQVLATTLDQQVLKLIILTPKGAGTPYDAFVYLEDRHIVPLHITDTGHFKQWMDIIFEEEYAGSDGQFILVLSAGMFSQRAINTGMLVDERPYENTGAYLYKNAPKQYNATEIAREKQHYINRYIDTSGAGLEDAVLKEGFAAFLKANSLHPNASRSHDTIYNKFEALSGYAFPQTLKTLFTMHNGVEGSGFLTAEEVLNEWKNWKDIYDDVHWSLTDLTGNHEPDGQRTLGIYTNPYWIPFFTTGGGNFLAIDYAPGNAGKSGQIIAFGADEVKVRFIAADMDDFLRQLTAGEEVLNNGFD